MAEWGWLIEAAESEASRPLYWAGSFGDERDRWTYDHQVAVRFARGVDAQRVAAGVLAGYALRIEAARAWHEELWNKVVPDRKITDAELALIDALSAFPAPASPWQPIETVPKDGTFVCLWWPYWRLTPVIGQYLENWNNGYSEQSGWRSEMVNDSRPVYDRGPLLWAPLPAPPSTSDRGE